MEYRADAAHGQISRRKGVQGVSLFNSEFKTFWLVGANSRVVDTVEGVLGRGYVIPLRGWHKCGPGHAGCLRRRSRKATKSEPQAAMSAGGPSVTRGIHARSGSGRESDATRRALTGWCRLGVSAGDNGTSEVGVIESVKAPPGVTSRGGSACNG